jgi:hypothetical protein
MINKCKIDLIFWKLYRHFLRTHSTSDVDIFCFIDMILPQKRCPDVGHITAHSSRNTLYKQARTYWNNIEV